VKYFAGLLLLGLVVLAGCGTAAAPQPTRSVVEARQTSVAIEAQPTLAPLPTSANAGQPVPTTPVLQPTAAASSGSALQVSADDPRAIGDPNAPVTMIEYTDYECPFCRSFFLETRPQIIEQYVETGVVRLVVRDFPLVDIHPSALLGSTASLCAAEQGEFFAMYEMLFATHQIEWGGVPRRDRDVMIEFAAGLNLDETAFVACLDDPASEQQIMDEMQAAMQLGINSTPNFLVNGRLLRGAQPFRVFEDLIRSEADL
jgi:protein-disulfide isomerase